ncbi:carbohydrate sulfotransferase 12-like [Salarias fasciatus]|uniref:carbohydrate sulfotransferase 12-like n=1 Tax=Salarias fasciatus TaxID=181472 RepID=UPI0011769525|nr:carbohydrate sulfotransferase 12-like [Salarias fasciatus]XP_029949561.1 carbohydrate sulfotransferase 12-like [Salarias fasciatus]
MGKRPTVKLAFLLASLSVGLLIFVYWENIIWFGAESTPTPNRPLTVGGINRTNKDPSQAVGTVRSENIVPATMSNRRIPVQQHEEVEQREEEELQEDEKESGGVSAEDMEQRARKQRIEDVCSEMRSTHKFPSMTRSFNQIPNNELGHFIVDDKHQIIYCYVPKVACTRWKSVMIILSQSQISPLTGKPYTDPKEIPRDVVHNRISHLTFDKFIHIYGSQSRSQMKTKLQTYTKFLFVRDPFVRLISAFRDKLGKPDQYFYMRFGSKILRHYGHVSSLPNIAEEAFAAGFKPTFQQFITYLLDPKRKEVLNEHWLQAYRLCHPCQVKYDFIGQHETFNTDAKQLLKLLKVDKWLHLPSAYPNLTETSWVRDWFNQIPIEAQRKLYKMYELDFKLFGYPKPDGIADE